MYAYLLLQLLVAGFILSCNIPTGSPTLGFLLISGLNLAGLFTLHTSSELRQYLDGPPTNSLH
ncbi:MAG: hypothetical protein EOO56_12015 [Hymenobacter sp.]|nr:MAG: hypothetical protein EOO56_12015 [Hymenobacter sp.]